MPDCGSGVDDVFLALADPTRWRLFRLLGEQPGLTATGLAAQVPVSRQAVVKHLTVLHGAGLVTRQRRGRDVVFRVRPDRVLQAASWLTALAATWESRLPGRAESGVAGESRAREVHRDRDTL